MVLCNVAAQGVAPNVCGSNFAYGWHSVRGNAYYHHGVQAGVRVRARPGERRRVGVPRAVPSRPPYAGLRELLEDKTLRVFPISILASEP